MLIQDITWKMLRDELAAGPDRLPEKAISTEPLRMPIGTALSADPYLKCEGSRAIAGTVHSPRHAVVFSRR